jgi:hypothetical protein
MNDRRKVTIVAGASSTGKTSFVLRYVLNAPAACRFIFDADGDYARSLKCAPAGTQATLDWQIQNSGWGIYDPSQMFAADYSAGLEWFAGYVWQKSAQLPGQKILVVDEINRFGVDPHNCPPSLATLAQAGRKHSVELLLTTHEPNRVNPAIANQLTEIVAFQQTDLCALEKLERYGFNPDEVGRLPIGSFVSKNILSGGWLRGKLF